MSIKNLSHEVLHDRVKAHIPDLPLKPRSIWVAILHHSVNPKDGLRADSFLWVKAHPKITLRTLANFYYQRNPLEELALQYRHEVPSDLLSVQDIRPKHPRDNLLVLRALDCETVSDPKLKAGIKYNEEHRLIVQGQSKDVAIDLVSDDGRPEDDTESEGEMIRGGKPFSRSDSLDSGHFDTSADLKGPLRPIPSISQQPNPPLTSVENPSSAPAPGHRVHPGFGGHESFSQPHALAQHEPLGPIPEQPPPPLNSGMLAPWSSSDEEYTCRISLCKQKFHVQLWTQWDGNSPMCLGHSIGYLKSRNLLDEAKQAEQSLMSAAREKAYWSVRGWEQELDEDVRVNKPHPDFSMSARRQAPQENAETVSCPPNSFQRTSDDALTPAAQGDARSSEQASSIRQPFQSGSRSLTSRVPMDNEFDSVLGWDAGLAGFSGFDETSKGKNNDGSGYSAFNLPGYSHLGGASMLNGEHDSTGLDMAYGDNMLPLPGYARNAMDSQIIQQQTSNMPPVKQAENMGPIGAPAPTSFQNEPASLGGGSLFDNYTARNAHQYGADTSTESAGTSCGFIVDGSDEEVPRRTIDPRQLYMESAQKQVVDPRRIQAGQMQAQMNGASARGSKRAARPGHVEGQRTEKARHYDDDEEGNIFADLPEDAAAAVDDSQDGDYIDMEQNLDDA